MDWNKAVGNHAWVNHAEFALMKELEAGHNRKPSFMPIVKVNAYKAQMQGSSTWEMLGVEDALTSLELMDELPSVEDFVCILQKCRKKKNLAYAKRLHMQIFNKGLEAHSVLGNYLVPMFVECGSMLHAQQVFDRLSYRNEYSWTSLIQGYIDYGGEWWRAFNLFIKMKENHIHPSRYTFVALLKACARLKCLQRGKEVHAEIAKEGIERDPFVGSHLVHMYAKCCSLAEAQEVFDKLPVRDIASWNAVIAGKVEQGLSEDALNFLMQMELEGVSPDAVTFVCSLKACGSIGAIDRGRKIHAEIANEGSERETVIGGTLVDMYAKCGSLEEAQRVFDELPVRDVVVWTALMAGYAEHGFDEEALNCLEKMQLEGVPPDVVTLVCSLKSCASIGAADKGRELHTEIVKEGFDREPYVGSTLVDMYVKFDSLAEAQGVSDVLQARDVFSWTVLVVGYAEHGLGEEVLNCLEQMKCDGMSPNAAIFVCSLKACDSTGAIDWGQKIHAEIVKEGVERDPFVGTTLVDMYAKFGLLAEARELFSVLQVRDVVAWTALIAGYAEHGLGEEALNCLEQMEVEGVSPDAGLWTVVIMAYAEQGESEKACKLYAQMQEQGLPPSISTFLNILKAYGSTAALESGKKIHAQIYGVSELDAAEVIMATALIGMYGKCGSIIDAEQVFDAMPKRDVVAWNSLIAGYARQGEVECVFHLFERMRVEGLQPDGITFLHVLNVCTHAGLVDKGHKYFEAMSKEHGVSPTIEHHNSIVDLFGRAGQLDEAVAMLEKMPCQPDLVVWMTVLGACRKWNNVELGRQAFECAVQLDENYAAAHILMLNIFADVD